MWQKSEYVSPWSSGQDVALSRLSQGFDSPRRYQIEKPLKALDFLIFQGFFSYIFPSKSVSKSSSRFPRCGTNIIHYFRYHKTRESMLP